MKLLILKRTEIKLNKNPRKNFEGLDELKENIRQIGITTPLIVDLNHRLIDGERRWRASEGILKELPCVEVDKKDWEKPDKRLEIQISIDGMSKHWNAIERAEAWKSYLDLGHSQTELAKLLGQKSDSTIRGLISLRENASRGVLEKLAKDDTNWTWHRDVEVRGGKLSPKQRAIIHQRIFDGAYESQDDLGESLKLAVDNPGLVERIVKATSPIDRQMIEFGATARPERAEQRFVPKKQTTEEKQWDYEERIVSGLISAVNEINIARILWARTDAVELVKKHLNKKQLNQVIESVETIVKVWTKTLKELKK